MNIHRNAAIVAMLAALGCDSLTEPTIGVPADQLLEDQLPWHLLDGRIAFVTDGPCGQWCRGAIQLADAETRTVREVIAGFSSGPPGHIEFEPGRNALTIQAFRPFPEVGHLYFTYQLYTIDLDDPSLDPLRPNPRDSHHTWGWSADGRLALVRDVPNVRAGAVTIDDLVLSDVAGNPAELTTITWSPDGSEIVLPMRNGSATPHLYAISVPDGTVTPLMPGAGDETYARDPAWSPVGDRIAYADGGLRLLDRATGQSTRLTSGAGAVWSPDGTAILFIRNDQPHMIDLATGKVTRLARVKVTAVAWAR